MPQLAQLQHRSGEPGTWTYGREIYIYINIKILYGYIWLFHVVSVNVGSPKWVVYNGKILQKN